MARGPNGEYRPNHPIGVAAAVMRIAIGQTTEAQEAARSNKQPAPTIPERPPLSSPRRRRVIEIDR